MWGARAAELRDRLVAARRPKARLLLLERLLTSWLRDPRAGHPVVGHALAAFEGASRRIGDVVEETGISSRRFIRLFSDEVGLTPKSFCRVRRFQRTVARLQSARTVDWADIALACGYCDQAHMIHDFRDFSGLSPTRYLSRHVEHMNHVPQ